MLAVKKAVKLNTTYSILGCGWLGVDLATFFISKSIGVKGSTTSIHKIEKLEELGITPFLIDICQVDCNEDVASFLNSEILIVCITLKDVDAFKNLIKHIEKSSIKKVVFVSSTSVYPFLNKEIIETDETLDTSLKSIEDLFLSNPFFETTVLRFAGLFGGKRHPGNWFENKKIPNPNGYVNMIHKEDCIQIIERIIDKKCWNEVFNACSNHHPTRKEFYTTAKRSLGKKLPVFEELEEVNYKIINSEKLVNQLEYSFIHKDLLKCL